MIYYTLEKYVSNSDLGSLNDALNLRTKPDNIQDIYDFGNLFDSMVTEPELLDLSTNLLDLGSKKVEFSDEKIKLSADMRDAILRDEFFNLVANGSIYQHEIYRERFEFQYQGYKYEIPARCKFDMKNKRLRIGADIKTTSCTSQKQFIDTMKHFNYDRQGAWYMDLARLERMVYFGVSKVKNKKRKHEVFTFAISKEDETYNLGKAKYSKLAYLYKHLSLNLYGKTNSSF